MKYRVIKKSNKYIIQKKILFLWFRKIFEYVYYDMNSKQKTFYTRNIEFENDIQPESIIKYYKKHNYKGYMIYPCLIYCPINKYSLEFYIKKKNIKCLEL